MRYRASVQGCEAPQTRGKLDCVVAKTDKKNAKVLAGFLYSGLRLRPKHPIEIENLRCDSFCLRVHFLR